MDPVRPAAVCRSGGALMSELGTISTSDVSQREKFGLWRDGLFRLCSRLGTQIHADRSFWGKIEYAMIGDVRVAKLKASRHRLLRGPLFVRRDSGDFLKVVLQVRGPSCFEQGGREVNLGPGEWCVYDAARPYSVSVPKDTETLMAVVPRANITTGRVHVEDLLVRKFSGRAGMGKLAVQFLASAFDEIPIITPEAEWEIAGAITNLVRLTMLEASEIQTEISLRQVWRDRIKSYIVTHLRDPELSIDRIALALNCTKRYVHKIFQPETVSVSEWILRMRLTRCREDLCNPARARASITDIAYSWGFNNPAHFSRAFKEEFHVSPSFFRTGARLESPISQFSPARRAAIGGKPLKLRQGEISSYS
jgi:AraC-like DNA-binding protein